MKGLLHLIVLEFANLKSIKNESKSGAHQRRNMEN